MENSRPESERVRAVESQVERILKDNGYRMKRDILVADVARELKRPEGDVDRDLTTILQQQARVVPMRIKQSKATGEIFMHN